MGAENREQKLVDLYGVYRRNQSKLSTMPAAAVVIGNAFAFGHMFLNPDASFALFYKQTYVWGAGLALLPAAGYLCSLLESRQERKRVNLACQIAALEGRTVYENNALDSLSETNRTERVLQLAFDTQPGLFDTGLFGLYYRISKRRFHYGNPYGRADEDMASFFSLAHTIDDDHGIAAEMTRDALLIRKAKLIREAQRPNYSKRRRTYAAYLLLKMKAALEGLPPLLKG